MRRPATGRRRTRTALAAAALALLAAGSCTRAGPPGPDPQLDGGALTWYVGATDQNQRDYARVVADQFEVANPNITIRIVYAPRNTDSARTLVTEALKAGAPNPPDVYLGDLIWPAEFASQGLALPLDDRFEPDFWARFPAPLVDSVRYQGRIHAVPFFVDQGVLLYRRDLVRTPPATWEDLVRQSRDLIRRGQVRYGYVWTGSAYEGLTCVWTEVLADAGGSTLTADGTRPAVDSAAGLKALRFLRDLVAGGISPPEVTSFEETEANQAFASGRAAFLRGWNPAYSRLVAPNSPDSPLRGKVGVAQLPTFAGQPGPGRSTTGGWSLFVNPASPRHDAATVFIRWVTAFQAQRQLAKFSMIPTNAQARQDRIAAVNPALRVGLTAEPIARPAATAAYSAVSRALYTQLNAALVGTLSPADALRRASQQIDDALP
jgi:multiple sugar transport system substrate-binding protein